VGLLSEDASALSAGPPDPLARIALDGPPVTVEPDRVLDRIEERFREGADPMDLVLERRSDQLGWWDAFVSAVRRREPYEVAWEAVKELTNDRSFDVGHPDIDFRRIDESVGPEIDYIVAGHTHLARVLRRTNGGGTYLNSGTWASLMRLVPGQVASPKAFKPVFERLSTAKTIADLGSLVFRRPTAVSVRRFNGRVEAGLDEVTLKNGKIALTRLG
jgi:hypothetical protein